VPYLSETVEYDAEAVAKGWKDREASQTILSASRDALASAPIWTTDALEPELRGLAERIGVAAGKIFQPLRVALTGVAASPGIFDVLVLLGRERSLARIDDALRRLAH
jgi:glutamyl-tRNA synthetase